MPWRRSALGIANLQFASRLLRRICNLRFAFCILQFFFVPFMILLGFPTPLWAADLFPRGEGYYFNLLNLIVLIILYLCWVRTCAWVDEDARQLHIPSVPWNPLMLGSGIIGVLVVWLLPWSCISIPILLILYLTPSLI